MVKNNVKYIKFKNCSRKIKNKITINDLRRLWKCSSAKKKENQKPDESYTKKYQKHAACSYSYKLVYTDDKFKNFKSY